MALPTDIIAPPLPTPEAAELTRLREKCERYREAIEREIARLDESAEAASKHLPGVADRLRIRADAFRRVIEE